MVVNILIILSYFIGFVIVYRFAFKKFFEDEPIDTDDFGDWFGGIFASAMVALVWPVTLIVFVLPYLYWKMRYKRD